MNVAQSPMAAGENIYESIKRIPGITDQSGLQFRNKSVTVYINDRPTAMSGEDLVTYLSAMPSNTVERVDVITNPPAKYDAAGRIIVNIILAKNKNYGTSGTLTGGVGAGRYGRYNSGFTLSWRAKNINIYGGADAAQARVLGDLHSDRYINAGNVIAEDQRTVTTALTGSFRLGLDYDINKRSSAGFLLKGVAANRDKDISNRSLLHYFSGAADSLSMVTTDNHSTVFAPSMNIYYKTQVGKNNGQLSVNADLYQYSKKWNDDFNTRFFDTDGKEYQPAYLLRDQSPANNSIRSFSADYSFKKGKISYETGLKSVFTSTDNDVKWESFTGGQWTNDAIKSNHFIYHENINAAYISMSATIKKFNVQLGLRAEQTNTEGNSMTLGRKDRNSYLSFFPSVDIGYFPSMKQQFSIA
ncbi:MAG: outer membrane beta-barrel protein, partial [Bacteroidetes bacterium]|nr:outer membrane beta-barrel protein [Bacteroidota bacterium]